METGTVKWFNEEGQKVQFNVTKGPKGWQAENVQVV
jgi:cold shock CspA family protein